MTYIVHVYIFYNYQITRMFTRIVHKRDPELKAQNCPRTIRSLIDDIGIFEIGKYFTAKTKVLMVTSKELYRSGNLKESRAL